MMATTTTAEIERGDGTATEPLPGTKDKSAGKPHRANQVAAAGTDKNRDGSVLPADPVEENAGAAGKLAQPTRFAELFLFRLPII
ncbi:hypothetical protein [Serratia rhizosphaerae]